jgi:hypothetical protein
MMSKAIDSKRQTLVGMGGEYCDDSRQLFT